MGEDEKEEKSCRVNFCWKLFSSNGRSDDKNLSYMHTRES